VKPPIILVISCCLAFAATANAATDQPHHLEPAAPRTVTVSEADTPPVIRAGLLQSTLIMLPAEEKVANVFSGDTVDWVFDGGHVASRFISVKPKAANTTTDIHIVSDHGNEYTLQLREVSNDLDGHFDSKVFIVPGDKAAKDRLIELPVFVPAAELESAKQEAAAAKAAQAAELSKDLQVPPAENLSAIRKALEDGGNKHAEVDEYPGLNHLFQTANTGSPSEYAGIAETMSPAILDKIAGWVLKQ
jgi:type IV secretion system protein VirB9